MAELYWIGGLRGGTAVAQVDTFTPANVEIGDIFTLTATGEDGSTAAVAFTATAATAANVAAGLVALVNASTNPLFTPILASGTSTVVLTARTAGVPFSVASSTTDGGGANTQTLARVATTASRGGSDWNIATNWSTGTVPVNGDKVTIDGRGAVAIAYGLNQSAVTLTDLRIYQSNLYNVGTSSAPLRIGVTNFYVGEAPNDGSSPAGAQTINVDLGSAQTTARIYNSRSSGTNGLEPVIIKGTHASNKLMLYGGTVGVASAIPGDVATFATVVVEAGSLYLSRGCTLAAIDQRGGKLFINSAATTVRQYGGTLTTDGTGAITTLTVGGVAKLNSTGTITTLTVIAGGTADFSGSSVARTVSNCAVHGDGQVNADTTTPLAITFTNGVDLVQRKNADGINLGRDITLTVSAI